MDTTAPASLTHKKPGFLINRNFALFWGGQSISNVGDFVFDTTLVLWIATIIAKGQTWAPLAVSGVLLATALPILLIGPIAGVFADRWDKRRTLLVMDASRAILIVLLLPVALGTLPTVWQLGAIYAIVLLTSACAQFFRPARVTLIGDLVEEPARARASGLSQTTYSLAGIIGPPIAAPLLFTIGVQWALIVNALSFVVSFLAILAVRVPRSVSLPAAGQHGVFQDFGAGIRFFVGNRVLVAILITVLLITLGVGALNALGVFFVTENLHAPANWYGFLGAAFGAGAVVGALLTSLFAHRLGEAKVFWLSLLAGGSAILLAARMTSFPFGVACYALIGLMSSPVDVVLLPLVLHVTPRELMGRVVAVLTPTEALASLLSVSLAGTLASSVLSGFHATVVGITFGPIDTILTGSGLLVLLGGLYAMVSLPGVTLADVEVPEAGAVPVASAEQSITQA